MSQACYLPLRLFFTHHRLLDLRPLPQVRREEREPPIADRVNCQDGAGSFGGGFERPSTVHNLFLYDGEPTHRVEV